MFGGKVIRKLIVDFDETLTCNDTTCTFAQLKARDLENRAAQYTLEWDLHCQDYFTNWKLLFEEEVSKERDIRSCKVDELEKTSARFRKFEEDSIEKTIKLEFLKGIKRSIIMQAGSEIPLKEHAIECLSKAISKGIQIDIISVNWSKDLICSTLTGRLNIQNISVYSNDLEFECMSDVQVTTGRIVGDLHSGLDKQKLVRHCKRDDGKICVYIGDSITDLLPAFEADLGIIISPRNSLIRLCNAFKIEILPLESISHIEQGVPSCRVYSVDSWKKLANLLHIE